MKNINEHKKILADLLNDNNINFKLNANKTKVIPITECISEIKEIKLTDHTKKADIYKKLEKSKNSEVFKGLVNKLKLKLFGSKSLLKTIRGKLKFLTGLDEDYIYKLDKERVNNSANLKIILNKFEPKEDFSIYLKRLIIEKNFKTIEVINQSYIEKSYFYQILKGSKNPSRDKTLQIALSMNLDKEEALKLLHIAGYGLSHEVKRDFIILYCMKNKLDTFKTNDILSEFKVIPLIV